MKYFFLFSFFITFTSARSNAQVLNPSRDDAKGQDRSQKLVVAEPDAIANEQTKSHSNEKEDIPKPIAAYTRLLQQHCDKR